MGLYFAGGCPMAWLHMREPLLCRQLAFAARAVDYAFVVRHLLRDDIGPAAQSDDLVFDPRQMCAEEHEPLLLIPRSLPDQLGIPCNAGKRHADTAQVDAGLQPLDVLI